MTWLLLVENAPLLCEHGKLDPFNSAGMEVSINTSLWVPASELLVSL